MNASAYEPPPLTPLIRVKLALRNAGLDWWTSAGPRERENIVWVEESMRHGLVWLRPLFDCHPAGLQLAYEQALVVIERFTTARDHAGLDGVDATLTEAQALWDQLVHAAEDVPSESTPQTIEVP